MNVSNIYFEVGGKQKLMKDFAEYLYLLGYTKVELYETDVYVRIRVNTKDKKFENVYREEPNYNYKHYHVEKDAEKIDRLITGPNKNLTEARDEFYKVVEEVENDIRLKNIEVNEPEEIDNTLLQSNKYNLRQCIFFTVDNTEDINRLTNLLIEHLWDYKINNEVFFKRYCTVYLDNYTSCAYFDIRPKDFYGEYIGMYEHNKEKIHNLIKKSHEPKLATQEEVDKGTAENLVFEDNYTLGNLQTVKDLLDRDWVGNTTLNTRVWGPWKIEKEIKSFEGESKKKRNNIINDALKRLKDTQGVKHNQGKLPIDTVLTKQFPKAVEALVKCSVYGHEKYNKNGEDEDWLNFKRVEGGSQTYADAAARHNQNKSEKDEESGLYHLYHKLWNVMAEVELWEEENHKE